MRRQQPQQQQQNQAASSVFLRDNNPDNAVGGNNNSSVSLGNEGDKNSSFFRTWSLQHPLLQYFMSIVFPPWLKAFLHISWNVFGSSALILACFVSTIPFYHYTNQTVYSFSSSSSQDLFRRQNLPPVEGFLALSIPIIIIVNILWFFIEQLRIPSTTTATAATTPSLPQHSSFIAFATQCMYFAKAWHVTMHFVLDISLFFIIGQTLSKSRNSLDTIPPELMTIPVLVAVYFIYTHMSLPFLFFRSDNNNDDASDNIAIPSVSILLGFIAFMVFTTYTPEGSNWPLAPPIYESTAMLLFVVLCVVYAVPARTRRGSPLSFSTLGIAVAASTICKCIITTTGILLFRNRIHSWENDITSTLSPSSQVDEWNAFLSQFSLYDYYYLRTIANPSIVSSQMHHRPSSSSASHFFISLPQHGSDRNNPDETKSSPLMTSSHVALNMFLRSFYAMCGCEWFSMCKVAFARWVVALGVKMQYHLIDMHEMNLAYVLFAIMLAAFSVVMVDEKAEGAANLAGGYRHLHSQGILTSVAILSAIAGVSLVAYLLRQHVF